MSIIRVAGIDPAFANFGMVKMAYDLITGELKILDLQLIQTEKATTKIKTLRKNSDDLRRSQELIKGQEGQIGFHDFVADCAVAFAEIPSGAKDANAARALGIATGVVASCPIPLFEVQVADAKLAAVGTKTASKEEMVEWAYEAYPDAPWHTHKSKGVVVPTVGKNEHLADATAIVHAGVGLSEFKKIAAIWKATMPAMAAA
jgi:Holliday junction resolvasome RuvABC endonuclease subunit